MEEEIAGGANIDQILSKLGHQRVESDNTGKS